MAKAKYKILLPPVVTDGKTLSKGEVELEDEAAQELVKFGVIEPLGGGEVQDPTAEINDQTPFTSEKVSVNSAPEEQLTALNHIGKTAAAKIIAGRPYKSLEEVQQKSGLKSELWKEIEKELSL